MARAVRTLLIGIMAGAGFGAAAAEYPVRPVTVIVPYAPGGATDIVARVLTDYLRKSLGQAFPVLNKPGANGIIALQELTKANPDGYTLMVGNVTTNAITPVVYPKQVPNYEGRVMPVTRLADVLGFLVVTATAFAPRTMGEFIAYAKDHPGKVIYASTGVGSYPHFDVVMFAKQAGIDLLHVPVNGGAAEVVKLLSTGDVQLSFLNSATAESIITAGYVRPIAAVAPTRLADHPDVPTMAEAGFPGIGTIQWQALFAPAGTPTEVVETLHRASLQALATEQTRKAFAAGGILATASTSPADAAVWMHEEIAHWRTIVTKAEIALPGQ